MLGVLTRSRAKERSLRWDRIGGAGAIAAVGFVAWITHATLPSPIPIAAQIATSDGPEIHYSPGENLERIDVDLIGSAGESIDFAAYVLTDVPVIEALAEAAERGVAVRLYRFPSEYEPTNAAASAIARLEQNANVVEKFKRGPDLMHLKSYCVDGRLLRAGAANFSASGLKRQNNDLIVLRGPAACREFEAAFEAMWDKP